MTIPTLHHPVAREQYRWPAIRTKVETERESKDGVVVRVRALITLQGAWSCIYRAWPALLAGLALCAFALASDVLWSAKKRTISNAQPMRIC